ncbi:MAG: hypothetical protein FVQ82_13090 [Planctomycetes bacterium]|nr:hypothetical protein [Planctomycetota bacterium]
MKQHENIKHFLHSVRDRLNKALLFRTVQWSFLGTGIALLLIASVFIIFGRAVPTWIYFTGLLCTAVAILAVWAIKRFDLAGACHFADNFFDLHDGVVSFTKFESQGRDSGFYELQADQVEDCVNHSDNPAHIPLGLSRRVCTIALALMIAALSMGFIDDSDAVKERRLQEELTLSKTEQVNAELRKELEDVLKGLEKEQAEDPDAKKQLNDLKRMVKELKITEDQKKALSQYAKLERELHKMLNSAQQRKDELLLDRVGEKLKSIRDGRQLGNKLSKKDYKAAAEELKKLKLKFDKKGSKEEKKKLAKLKNISQQMAAAAESSLSKMSGKNNESQSPDNISKMSKSGKCTPQESSSEKSDSQKSLAQKMAELKEATENYKKSQCEMGSEEANAKMGKLGDALSKLGSKRLMQMKMKSLSKKLGQCQGFMTGGKGKSLAACISQMESPDAGGKGIGMGTSNKTSSEKTPDNDNGNITSIEGIKGDGPSEVTTEEANSGTGSASNAAARRQLQYRKQAEAYIQRQDVPSEVKQGVKHYFENIHQTEN